MQPDDINRTLPESLRTWGERVHHSWNCEPKDGKCACGAADLMNEAADEIERLRAELAEANDDFHAVYVKPGLE